MKGKKTVAVFEITQAALNSLKEKMGLVDHVAQVRDPDASVSRPSGSKEAS